MKFSNLSFYLNRLEKTPSRIAITEILAELFKVSGSDEIDKITYLLLGKLAPNYKSIVFNIADRMMMRVIAKAYETTLEDVEALFKGKGDLGIVAQELARGKDGGLSVGEVYDTLLEIAVEHGENSQERKVNIMANLISKLDPLSSRYVTRIPLGKLRLGFSDKTVLDALSWMERGDKSAKKTLDDAYQVLPDVGLLAKEVKSKGIEEASKEITPIIGVPVLPMLAQRLKSPADMIKKMGKVAVEPKLDGLRIQIHFKRGKFVKAFTRNMHEVSWMFPELGEIGKYITVDDVILDTEAIGVDEERKMMANFQSTMTRRRKHDIEETSKKVGIQFYVFDVLYCNGKNLLGLNYLERKDEYLKVCIKKNGSLLKVVDYILTSDPQTVVKLHLANRKEGFEGIIVKRYDSAYVPGRTGWRWVKMKEAEADIGKLSDTVDCVVMGYSAGKGKRVSFGLGQFLVGVGDGEIFKTVTKVGTGLTDEQFRELKKRLSGMVVKDKPKEYEVNKLLEPDFWVTPSVVVEIAADEITKSPSHTAGFALRFPRLVKFRDDKSPEEATTVKEVEKLNNLQNQ